MYLSKINLNNYKEKIALVRIDLNLEEKNVLKNLRLIKIIPTVNLLLENKIKIVFISHFARPNSFDKKYSLKKFQKILSKILKKDVVFLKDLNFLKNKAEILKNINNNKNIFLLENLRFYPDEEKNNLAFAKKLASLGDFYINEAFSVSHRKHASVYGIVKFLPSFLGLIPEEEIINLNKIINKFKKPFVLVLGGAKIKDKLSLIKYFLKKVDYILLGGGPANTFSYLKGYDVKVSLYEKDEQILKILKRYLTNKKIITPFDFKFYKNQILDIGSKTILTYQEIIKKANSIIFNGPMGYFEKKGFDLGTKSVWQALLKNQKAQIVVGGGETLNSYFLVKSDFKRVSKNIFFSTGGGAMLEYLSGKDLPGLKIVDKNYKKYYG